MHFFTILSICLSLKYWCMGPKDWYMWFEPIYGLGLLIYLNQVEWPFRLHLFKNRKESKFMFDTFIYSKKKIVKLSNFAKFFEFFFPFNGNWKFEKGKSNYSYHTFFDKNLVWKIIKRVDFFYIEKKYKRFELQFYYNFQISKIEK